MKTKIKKNIKDRMNIMFDYFDCVNLLILESKKIITWRILDNNLIIILKDKIHCLEIQYAISFCEIESICFGPRELAKLIYEKLNYSLIEKQNQI